jgi:hypothetical protein
VTKQAVRQEILSQAERVDEVAARAARDVSGLGE